jgi:uncharacterized iron-regulated protein
MASAMRSDKPAYIFYDKEGKEARYNDLVKDALKADIIFFGESHNNPLCHWLQLELANDLFKDKKNNLILGAEMFESDNALILNEYLTGKIKESNFEKEAKLWPNYMTDYRPLVNFAKENNLTFIATNIPRRYAAIVSSGGFEALDSLSEEAKGYIAPLPIRYDPELKCYKDMLSMGPMGKDHNTENFPKAQAIKDATMSWFILSNWQEGKAILHFNGSYHSDDFQGIVWYIKQDKTDIKILTITTVEQDTITELNKDYIGKADYILCVPTDMTKTNN